MKSKVIPVIVISVAIYFAFSTCVIWLLQDDQSQMTWDDRQAFNNKFIERLKIGADKSYVIEELGPPDLTEAKQIEQSSWQVMLYRTHHQKSDGFTTADECTVLLFADEQLVATGDSAYQQFKEAG